MGAEYRSMLGYLPQNVGMYKNFSGKKMLMYLAALKGIPSKREAEQAVDQVLEQVNLSQDKNRRIGQYSGGMRQRLGIAQALIGDPQLLIFDEPTAGLDPKERIRFMNIISELANERTILLATHIVSDIEQIAGQILFLKEGELIAQGSLSQCLDLLKNSVFEKLCTHQEYEKIVEDYRISRVISAGEKLMVRFVGPQPIEDSHLVEPTLEDVYIHFFGEAGI